MINNSFLWKDYGRLEDVDFKGKQSCQFFAIAYWEQMIKLRTSSVGAVKTFAIKIQVLTDHDCVLHSVLAKFVIASADQRIGMLQNLV